MDFDKSIVDDFVIEAKEHLENVEEDLLTLEKSGGDCDAELINRVFRAVHTVKGTAGFIGLAKLASLAHVLETILSMIRSGDMKPDASVMDELLQGVDILRSMLDNVYESNDVDTTDIMEKLVAIAEGTPDIATDVDMLADEAGDFGELIDIAEKTYGFDVDKSTLDSVPESHKNFYVLEYDFHEFLEREDLTPSALLKHLEGHGFLVDIQADTPVQDLHVGIPDGPFPCKILYATKLDSGSVGLVVMLPDEKITSLENASSETASTQVEIDDEDLEALFKSASEERVRTVNKPEVHEVVAMSKSERSESSLASPPVKIGIEKAETLRLSVGIIDKLMTLAGELVLVRNQYIRSVDKSDPTGRAISQRLDVVTSELQEGIMATRMQPVGNIFNKFQRVVRELGKNLGKTIEIEIIGSEVELDKTIIEALADPLTHLIRNCCDHGIERPEARLEAGKPTAGHITLRAYHEGGQINIEIKDDGKGIDVMSIRGKAIEKGLKTEDELNSMSEKDILALIFLPGFSMAKEITDVSGRGVGMDVVKTAIDSLGGILDMDSTLGEGTTMFLRLPLTLAIIPCLIIRSGDYRFAIPQINVEELVCLYDDDVLNKIECAGDKEVYRLRNRLLSMSRLNEVLERSEPFTNLTLAEITETYRVKAESALKERTADDGSSELTTQERLALNFAVLKIGVSRLGLVVDEVLGTEEIVVKPVHPAVKDLGIYSGATVMGDGKVALILDIQGIARHTGLELDSRAAEQHAIEAGEEADTQNVLLFNIGMDEQFAISLPLIKRIERVDPSSIEKIGDSEFLTIDRVSTKVVRIDSCLDVATGVDKKEMFLLLPKHINKPVGILISELSDIETVPLELNIDSYMEDGLLGTAIVRDKMTLFLDVCRLIEKTDKRPLLYGEVADGGAVVGGTGRILLVEDAPFFRSLIKGYLEAAGHHVMVAENGQKGMDIFKENEFDLVLADLEMPVMDGFDFVKKIRGEEHNVIPAVALTASDSAQVRQKAKESGFNEFEVKVDREHLLMTISDLLPKVNEGQQKTKIEKG